MTADDTPDALEILNRLGAKWSPDFDAYASGAIPAWMVRCVLCETAPCKCRYCQAAQENVYHLVTGRPPSEPCGMRIDPATGECPRGHIADADPEPDAQGGMSQFGSLPVAPDYDDDPPAGRFLP
jgi:hypothetical protein